MSYVVSIKNPKGKEISLDQILSCEVDISKPRKRRIYPGTVTKFYDNNLMSLYTASDIKIIIDKLSAFNKNHPINVNNLNSSYKHFKIPKQSGGLRDIFEPKSNLYESQVDLRTLFQEYCNAAYHTTAFAYVKGRNILYCIKRHQANKSKWFLKIDFSDFFGNTNYPFVIRQLKQIMPFDMILQNKNGEEELTKALKICFLNGGLPQGTPISPMLTNLIMIPIDHELNKVLHKKGFVYTRYADDIQISHKEIFDPNDVLEIINQTLKRFLAPYQINEKKTRFCSSSGKNFNLGLMLNRENNITIGHKRHKIIKARINSFIMDYKHNKAWNYNETVILMGQLAYWKYIEPKTYQYTIDHFNKKYNVDFENMLKSNLKSNVEITRLRQRLEAYITF